jgi:uncharacterized membrane protein
LHPAGEEDIAVEQNIGTWQRVGSVAGGLALLYMGARRPRVAAMTRATGVGLVLRGMAGYCPVTAATTRDRGRTAREALAGPRGIHVQETIAIDRPRHVVYGFWRQLSNLPRFMSHLERVDLLGNGRSHWVASGPLGRPVEWDAEIINEVEGYLLAWQSLPGADVDSAGSVRFRDLQSGGTELTVHLQYQPPAGKLGAWAAWMTGEEPTRQIHDDLRAVKRYLETGVELAAH